jgi:hypothetical protein
MMMDMRTVKIVVLSIIRDSGCSEYGNAYEDGFSVGCQSVEGNTYDSCE